MDSSLRSLMPAPACSPSTVTHAQDAAAGRPVTPEFGGARHITRAVTGIGSPASRGRQDAVRTIRAARRTTSEDTVMESRFDLFANETGAKIGKRFYNVSLAIQQSS